MRASIIHTLAYFDLFDYPLTEEELYAFLWQPPAQDMHRPLAQLIDESAVYRHGPYMSLRSGTDGVQEREKKVARAAERYRIAGRAAKKMRWIPFLRGVWICNQLPVTVKATSDIDVLIVVRAGRLWLVRLMTTVVLSVFGLRRHNACVAKHVCLSFYVTDDALDLSTIALPGIDDVYLIYWIAYMLPLYDPEGLTKRIAAANSWAYQSVPHAKDRYSDGHRIAVMDNRVSRLVKRGAAWILGGTCGAWCERLVKQLQLKKMQRNTASKQSENTSDVIVSDTMLKFHENDRRKQFFHAWKTVCDRYQN